MNRTELRIVGGVEVSWPVEVDRPWTEDASCKWLDTDYFYPRPGEDSEVAKRICRACPVRADCLEYALQRPEQFGIWGGLDEHQRRRRLRRAAA